MNSRGRRLFQKRVNLSKTLPVSLPTYALFPLGDSAVTLDLGPVIDEHHNIRVQTMYEWLQRHPFPGLLDVVIAYSSVSVFYDPAVVRASGLAGSMAAAAWVKELLVRAWDETGGAQGTPGGHGVHEGLRPGDGSAPFRIPVCYEGGYAPDLEPVARQLGLAVQEVIDRHCARVYRVYMIGFLPGFPYLGTVDPRLEVPRKLQPVPVAAGGVGIAGRQTGIYPLNSPGGWSIIGRTPVRLFDPQTDPPVRLQTGDRVEFYPISTEEFLQVIGLSR
jgi:inhibitor of KinA